MKVCLASWAPFYAGAEVAALRLAVGLREAGHEVFCVVGTEGELQSKLVAEGIKTYFVPQRFTDKWKWLSYRRSRNELVRILKIEQPDVVHSNDLPTHQMAGDAARKVGIPRICHHRWIFEGAAIDWLNKFGAERHVFVSRALMEDLCGNSAKLLSSEREVVYDGLPLPQIEEAEGGIANAERRTVARCGLGLEQTRGVILFAGQIIQRKGVADLLVAWHRLIKKWGERFELVIVGEDFENKGEYRSKMESLASELSISPRFVGFQRDIYRWYAAADIVAFPSTNEPLGLIALESMAHAVPVVACAVGGIVETVLDGKTGLLVPPNDPSALASALDQLLDDERLRVCLGSAGRRRCEQLFSLEAHVSSMLRQYEMVLEGTSVAVS